MEEPCTIVGAIAVFGKLLKGGDFSDLGKAYLRKREQHAFMYRSFGVLKRSMEPGQMVQALNLSYSGD